MPLDRRAQRLLDMLAATRQDGAHHETPSDRREALRAFARMVDDSSEAVGGVDECRIPGPSGPIGLRVYAPLTAPAGPLPGLVFFHGGGWVAGDFDTHDGLCRRLANHTGARVIAVDYRLAPEHRFPAGIEDCLAATHWVAEHADAFGVDPDRLAVGGDSAGGGLAAVVCQLARDRGGPELAAQLLICPILDIGDESASRGEFGEGYFISRAALARDLDDYCPAGADRGDARLSPLRAARFEGLPPAVLHTAAFDPFRDEGLAYGRRLAEAGVPVGGACHDGMIHYFYAMPRAIPYAQAAMAAIGADFRAMIAGS